MKTFNKVFALLAITTAIVIFWLMPGVNQAEDTEYTRRYEDTDALALAATASPDTVIRENDKSASLRQRSRPEKKYKTESISSKTKLKDVNMKMYSRAVQFEKVAVVDSLEHVSAKGDTVTSMP